MTPPERVYNKIKAHFEAKPYLSVIGINKLLDGFNSGYDVLSPSLLIKHTHSKEEAIAIIADFMSVGYTNPRYPDYVLHYAIADCDNMLASAYQPTSADKSRVSDKPVYTLSALDALKEFLALSVDDSGVGATNYYRQESLENRVLPRSEKYRLADGTIMLGANEPIATLWQDKIFIKSGTKD